MARGQFFTTLDDAELDKWGGSCREYTSLRDNAASKVKGWICGNTKIGPAWEVAVGHHQGRYGIEIMIESLFGDGTCSWVMIVNGIDKYVTEMMEESREDHIDYIGVCTGKLVANARPKQTSMTTTSSSSTTLPCHLRVWIDVEPGPNDKSCFEVSKKMIRLLRDDPSVLREEDGAVEFRILAQMFRSKFTSSQYWSIRAWLNYLQKEEVLRRDPSIVWIHSLLIPSKTFEQFKATVEENTSIRHCKTTCCYQATSPSTSTTLEAPTLRTRSFNLD